MPLRNGADTIEHLMRRTLHLRLTGRRWLDWLIAATVAAIAAAVLAYLLLVPWIARSVAGGVLRDLGYPQATFAVAHVLPWQAELVNLQLAPAAGVGDVERIVIGYTPLSLWRGRVTKVRIVGAQIDLTDSRALPVRSGGSAGSIAGDIPVGRLELADAVVTVPLRGRSVQIPLRGWIEPQGGNFAVDATMLGGPVAVRGTLDLKNSSANARVEATRVQLAEALADDLDTVLKSDRQAIDTSGELTLSWGRAAGGAWRIELQDAALRTSDADLGFPAADLSLHGVDANVHLAGTATPTGLQLTLLPTSKLSASGGSLEKRRLNRAQGPLAELALAEPVVLDLRFGQKPTWELRAPAALLQTAMFAPTPLRISINLAGACGRTDGSLSLILNGWQMQSGSSLAPLFPALDDYDMGGTVTASAYIRFDQGRLEPKVAIELGDGRLASPAGNWSLENVESRFVINSLRPFQTAGGQRVSFGRATVGKLQLDDGVLIVDAANAYEWTFRGIRARLADGRVQATPFALDLRRPQISTVVALERVRVGDLLPLLTDQATASATAWGQLPMILNWPQSRPGDASAVRWWEPRIEFGEGYLVTSEAGTLHVKRPEDLLGQAPQQQSRSIQGRVIAGNRENLVNAMKDLNLTSARVDFMKEKWEGRDALLAQVSLAGRGQDPSANTAVTLTVNVHGFDSLLRLAMGFGRQLQIRSGS